MAIVVDFHTHVIPDRLSEATSPIVSRLDSRIENLRTRAREWIRPITGSLHQSQTLLRIIPESFRKPFDELAIMAPLAGLLFESSPRDLSAAMKAAGADYAVVIAHAPHLSNATLLEICDRFPQFIPAVNIPPGTEQPGKVLRTLAKKGARLLKIHAAADGEGPESPRYRALLKVANELQLPVILHTGYMQSRILYKDPAKGKVGTFAPWFDTYKDIRFILAHMNMHEPAIALDFAEEYPNLYVDTSWQPSEMIGEAVRRIGAARVLFGSDWPLIGNNVAVGMNRVRDCVESGMISEEQAELVLGKNAECLLNLPSSPPTSS